MAYPATTKTLSVWLQEIDQKAALIKQSAQQQHAASSAGQLNMDLIRRFFDLLVSVNAFFVQAEGVPGLAAYVTSEKQSQVANPLAEFTSMRSAIVATLNWLRTNVPAGDFSGQSYKLGYLFPADNTTPSSAITFTALQTATYRTVIQALIDTIS